MALLGGILDFWRHLWVPFSSSEQGAVRGGVIVLVSRFLIKAIYFIKTIILARLLFPNDFGLFGMAAATAGVLDLFQPGFNAALVHEKGDVRRYLDSVWTFNILRNGFFGAVLFFLAPLIGEFFANDVVTPLVRAMAFVVFLDGFVNVGTILFQKELDFKKKMRYDLSYVTGESIVVVAAALLTQSPWALVAGAVGNRIFSVVSSFVLYPHRPRFSLDKGHLRRLFGYGKWVSLAALLSFVATKIDVIAIGRLLTPDDVGFFQIALGLAMLPSLEVARVLGTVVFPYVALIREDKVKVRAIFSGITHLVTAIVVPTIFGFLIFGDEFVREVYGDRWAPVVPLVSLLLIVGCLRALEYVIAPIAQGTGHPDIPAKSLAVHAFAMGVTIVPLVLSFGVMGAAWAWLVASIAARLYGLILLFREIGSAWGVLCSAFVLPGIAGCAMYLVLVPYTGMNPPQGVLSLVSGIGVGALLYGVMLYALDSVFGKHLLQSILWLRRRM